MPQRTPDASIQMVGKIRVGHVEVDDFWVTVETNTPVRQEDVIRMSGMFPRDGTPVRCFRSDGTAVLNLVHPGEEVIVGSRPPPMSRTRKSAHCPNCHVTVPLSAGEIIGAHCPSCSTEFNLLSIHKLRAKWSRQMGVKRSYASGPIGRKSTIHIPVQVGHSLVGEEIDAIEVSRHSRVNGAIHATGYRIRSYNCPYNPGDFGIVQSTGDNRLLLFDPKTGTASVEAKILENSLEATRVAEDKLGRRHFWVIKILHFNPVTRVVSASVDRPYTWRMSQSRFVRSMSKSRPMITSEGNDESPLMH